MTRLLFWNIYLYGRVIINGYVIKIIMNIYPYGITAVVLDMVC